MHRRTDFLKPAASGDEAPDPVEQSLQSRRSVPGAGILDLFREVAIEREAAVLSEHLEGVYFGTASGEDRLDNQAVMEVELHRHAVAFGSDGPHRSVDAGDLPLEDKANEIDVVTSQIEQRPTAYGTGCAPRCRSAARDREHGAGGKGAPMRSFPSNRRSSRTSG